MDVPKNDIVKKVKKKARGKFVGYISTALAFIVGLAWNDAIGTLIKYFFPLDTNTLLAKLIYATLLTGIVISVIIYLESFLEDE